MTEYIIGTFALIAGLIHLLSTKSLEKYAIARGSLGADRSVKLAALYLIGCGAASFVPRFSEYAGYGVSIFLLITAFTIHKFWDENDPQSRLSEMLHFLKNLALAAVIFAVQSGL